jgi:hypothetical protein
MSAATANAATSVEIRHAVAQVTVIPEARPDVSVMVVRTNRQLPLRVTQAGDLVVVDGGLGLRSPNCGSLFGRPRVTVWGLGSFGPGDLPQVVVRTPLDARIAASGAVFGVTRPGGSLDLANSGCGDWTVADQAGSLRARLAGSGDLHAGSAGAVDLQLSGSSNVVMRTARQGLNVGISGSGDVRAAMVNGPLRARVGGSGDVRVGGGAVTDMDVNVAGSGDVRFGGVAGRLEARVAGSGDVTAARVTGPVKKQVSGSGDVTVGR